MAFATLIICVGCGGEWLFGGRATSAARQLQDIAQTDVANANDRANQAALEAAKAGVAVTTLSI